MRYPRVCLTVLGVVLVGTGVGWAQPPNPDSESRLLPPTLEIPAIEAQSATNLPAPGEAELIEEKINTDRIDLGPLLEAAAKKDEREALPLSLNECVELALRANPDIMVATYEPLKADGDILAAQGEFDPILSGNAAYNRSTQSASSQVRAFAGVSTIEAYQTTGQTAVGGKLLWGTQYSVALNLNKEETTYNQFIEEWSGGLTLTLTQPLLQGRGKAINRIRIRQARNLRNVTEHQLHLTVMTAVTQTVKAYWDLVGALDNVRVREESLANAKRLLEINQKRLDIGTVAAIDVIQAKAGVATRISDLLAAQSRVKDAEDLVKQLLNMRAGDTLVPTRLTPVDAPTLSTLLLDEAKSIASAFDNRPELLSALLDIENAELERRRLGDALQPRLEVTSSVSQGGRGHYASDVFRGIDNLADSVARIPTGIEDREDFSYSVGFQGSIPIGNRTARGAYARGSLAVQQAEKQLEKAKLDAVARIRFAARSIDTSRILVLSTGQARALQETNLAAEEKRLNLGLTTSYRVLQVQEDLTLAQTQEVQALINHEKALVDLQLAEGLILKNLGVEFEAPEPSTPISFIRSIRPPALK